MKQNQNPRHNRQGRQSQHNKPHQHTNQKRNGKSRHNNQGRHQQPPSPTRQMDSRGPAGSVRGNAKQLYDRYKALAEEKRSLDRVEFEALSQYADHYYRIHSEFAAAEAALQAKRDQAKEEERVRKEEAEARNRTNGEAEDQPPPKKDKEETLAKTSADQNVEAKAISSEPETSQKTSEKPPEDAPKETAEETPVKKRRGRPAKAKEGAEA